MEEAKHVLLFQQETSIHKGDVKKHWEMTVKVPSPGGEFCPHKYQATYTQRQTESLY